MVPEQAVFLLADLNRAAAKLRDQDLVAGADAHGYSLAFPVHHAGAYSQHLCLVELLHGAVGEEQTTGGLGLSFHALHENAVQKRCEGFDGLESGRLNSLCQLRRRWFGSPALPSWRLKL